MLNRYLKAFYGEKKKLKNTKKNCFFYACFFFWRGVFFFFQPLMNVSGSGLGDLERGLGSQTVRNFG